MPGKKVSLALSFIAEAPDAAAKILEQSKVSEVAAFLEDLPLDYQYQVIEQLLPSFAARLCLEMGSERAAAILTDLQTEKLARILRLMPKGDTDKVLANLPSKQRDACRQVLKYSTRVVGAWMHADIIPISMELSVGEALKVLQEDPEVREQSYVYVTDRDSTLIGRISFMKLIKSRATLSIKDVIERNVPHLSAQMLIEHVHSMSVWNQTDTVAVVDKEFHLQGIIRYCDVHKALSQSKDHSYTQSHTPGVVSGITGVYGKTLLVLLNNLMNVIEPDLKS